MALSCVAITERPTAHQGRLRLARKYDSVVRSSFVRLMPSQTSQEMNAATIAQSTGCMPRAVYANPVWRCGECAPKVRGWRRSGQRFS